MILCGNSGSWSNVTITPVPKKLHNAVLLGVHVVIDCFLQDMILLPINSVYVQHKTTKITKTLSDNFFVFKLEYNGGSAICSHHTRW